jgi:hypothetical protein
VGLPADAAGFRAGLEKLLSDHADRVDAGYPGNLDLVLDAGKPVLRRRRPGPPDWHPAAAAAVAEAAGLTTKDGLAAAPVRRKLATALLIINLAANIPNPVLVDLLGISIDAANRWAKHASSDWGRLPQCPGSVTMMRSVSALRWQGGCRGRP